jgi:hypothetical protein
MKMKLQFISRNAREIKLRTEIIERVLQLIHEFDEFMVHFGRFREVRKQDMKGRLLAGLRVANDLRRRGPSAKRICPCFRSSRHIYVSRVFLIRYPLRKSCTAIVQLLR